MDDEMKKQAFMLASKSYAVYPLAPRKKIPPIIKDWYNQATTDAQKINEWWRLNPNANIGVACGTPSHGLVVIDVDSVEGHGKDGFKSIEKWEREHGAFPETLQVRTPTGGLHLYFRDNRKWITKNQTLEGVDVRAEDAGITAPPSKTEKGVYEWLKDCPELPAMINDSVRELLELAMKEAGGQSKPYKYHESTFVDTGEPIGEGERNDMLCRIAGSLIRKHPEWSYERLSDEIRKINDERCVPPLPAKQLQSLIKGAKKWKERQDNEPPIPSMYPPSYPPEEPDSQNQNISEDDLKLTSLSDIQEKEVEWLIPNYVPKRMITIICGTGGSGKTTLWCSLLSSVSQGKPSVLEGLTPRTDIDRVNRSTLYFSSEDSTEYVLKGRLLKNHADMQNVHFIDLSDPKLERVKFTSKFLDKLMDKYRPALCVFDPLQSFINAGGDMAKRNFMREQIHPLVTMGEKYNTTFIIIVHTNKKTGSWGRYRMADSQDIWDQARSVLMLGEADKEQHTVYVSQEKCNVAPLAQTVILKNSDSVMTFESYTDKKDRDFVLEEQNQSMKRPENRTEECCNSILSALSEENGEMLAHDLESLLIDMGYTRSAREDAKKNLKDGNQVGYKKEIDPRTGKQKIGGKWIIYKK